MHRPHFVSAMFAQYLMPFILQPKTNDIVVEGVANHAALSRGHGGKHPGGDNPRHKRHARKQRYTRQGIRNWGTL